jgi:5-methylcytosine-specific restriction endonuclease McrA
MKHIKYTKELLEEAVSNSVSVAGVLRYLNLAQAGGTQCHLKRRIISFGIDYSHFTGQGHNKGKISNNRKTASEILICSDHEYRVRTPKLNRALSDIGRKYECVECGVGEVYNNKPIVLQIDHIDGNSQNNVESNLRFICPNCHSQTPTWCRKKK